ncbi:hypothetical protein D3C87_1981430 [compost metagenome]
MQAAGDRRQGLVAAIMAMAIVEALEMIDVEDRDRDGQAELARLAEQPAAPLEEMAAVVKAGEIVARG